MECPKIMHNSIPILSVERMNNRSEFCGVCHSILDFHNGSNGAITCGVCGNTVSVEEYAKSASVSLRRKLNANNETLNSLRQSSTKEKDSKHKLAIVKETCPKCGFEKMEFYTLQMRNADEGQTVFFSCLRCRHKFSTNT